MASQPKQFEEWTDGNMIQRNRRWNGGWLWGVLLVRVLWCESSPAWSAPRDVKRPNIIVFLVDDMGLMDTSLPFLTDAEGRPKRYPLNAFYRTPNMERLAARGIRFSQFYAMSVCSPTRISIMTGQNAARHGATNWINPSRNNGGPQGPPEWDWKGLSRRDVTLARLLQTAGYRTIHIGKGHFGPTISEGADPKNLGFDINVGGAAFGAPGSYYGEKNYGLGTRRASHAVPHLEAYHGSKTFLTEALTREAERHVRQAVQSGKPFYLYMAHYAVHAPFQSDPRFASHYTSSGKPRPAQAFATLIEGMDKSLGDLLDLLDELEVASNTLVFFLGDNGSDAPLGHQHKVASSAPLRGRKGAHYEGGMRVPLIAAWARPDADEPMQRQLPIPQNAIQHQMAVVYDLFPTVLEAAGVASPPDHVTDGQSLRRLLSGEADPHHRRTFLMHYPHAPHRSNYFTVYREGDWKVVYHYFPPANGVDTHYELFHLSDDPFESRNVAQRHPKRLRAMMKNLVAELKGQGARMPISKPGGEPVWPVVPH